MARFNILKLLLCMILLSGCDLVFDDYDVRVKQIDDLIQHNVDNLKSTEKLNMSKYNVDSLDFQRISKIRNIFSSNHLSFFEETEKILQTAEPLAVPFELQKIIKQKTTKLQRYPIGSFKFEGVVLQDSKKWGVVKSSKKQKSIYFYFMPGEIVGKNYGQVKDIGKEGIFLNEWKKDIQQRVWRKIQTIIN